MTEIDLALRAAAGALIAASMALLLVHRTLPARLGALFAAGVGAYLVCSAPGFAALPLGVHLALVWVCVANPVFFWLFARALFDDEFSPGVSELAALIVVEALGLVRVLGRSHMPEWLDIATFLLLQAMNLAFIAHAMVVALSGRAGDLIEERR